MNPPGRRWEESTRAGEATRRLQATVPAAGEARPRGRRAGNAEPEPRFTNGHFSSWTVPLGAHRPPDLQAPSQRGRPCPCPARLGWKVPLPLSPPPGAEVLPMVTGPVPAALAGHSAARLRDQGREGRGRGQPPGPPGRTRAPDSGRRGGGRPPRGWGSEGAATAPAQEERTSSHRLPAALPRGARGADPASRPRPGAPPPVLPPSL